MMDNADNVNQRIAAQVRRLRAATGLSLDALAAKTGVSRSMLSLIERGESSPTAIVLERLAVGLNVTLASLFEAAAEDEPPDEPVQRRASQVVWQDPETGYVRRNLSPPHVPQPLQLVEIEFPAKARVVFESQGRDVTIYQQIVVLDGTIEITYENRRQRLKAGDCLAMKIEGTNVFENPTRKPARYLVASATEFTSKRKT
ncbi:MAG: helix-turn-helix transcriptional regulator [Planctomycetaceae bacterium]|nr:helix-turn-helix transcriptional regulator [Planctomycetaceae bacterium]